MLVRARTRHFLALTTYEGKSALAAVFGARRARDGARWEFLATLTDEPCSDAYAERPRW
jgi:hypothetical protein